MENNLIAMAAMLKRWRVRCDLSVYRIAKELNMDAHTLARIEKGEEVNSSALLNYISFIRRADPDWNIIEEWEKMKGFIRKVNYP